MWAGYIQLLSAHATVSNGDELRKARQDLRKAYRSAVQSPLENVKKLWEDLESFEHRLCGTAAAAQKVLDGLRTRHMLARRVLDELKNHHAHLDLPQVQRSSRGFFMPTVPTFNPTERQLLGNWKRYLRWEEGNPLMFDDEHHVKRVIYSYKKAFKRMRYYSEIWFVLF